MPQIYETSIEFTATSGEDNCQELLAPSRGILRKLIVKQINGALAGFTFDLLNRFDACPSVAEISLSGEDAGQLMDLELHRIIDQITIASSNALSSQFSIQSAYANEDEQDNRKTPNSRIYLSLNPTGTGDKIFQVAYAIEPIEAL